MIPTSDSNLSLDSLLVDQVINLVSSMIDPTLPSESEVVESMSFPPDPTLSLESVKTEVVSLTKSSSCSSLPIENEPKPVEVFIFVLIVLDKKFFCLFRQNPLQVMRLFPLTGVT